MYSPNDNLLGDDGLELEAETLQIDIWRFFAILGFLVMAVFALVQSLPVTTGNDRTVIEILNRDLELKTHPVPNLQVENEPFKTAEPNKKPLPNKISADPVPNKPSLSTKTTLARPAPQLVPSETVVQSPLKVRPAIKPEESPKISQEPVKPPMLGLYVAFSSPQAFLKLLETKKIVLFVLLESIEKPFRVRSRAGHIDFISRSPAGDFDLWKISPDQVPEVISESFRQWTTLAASPQQFIVGLSAAISDPIRMKSREGGRFLIHADGSVSHVPWEE